MILVSGAGLAGRAEARARGARAEAAQGGGWHVTSEAGPGATVCRSPATRPHTPQQVSRPGSDRAQRVSRP